MAGKRQRGIGNDSSWRCAFLILFFALLVSTASCGQNAKAKMTPQRVEVGVVKVVRKPLQRTLTVSSELVPFQQIDVYAKESGFVQKLNVDYGSHVQAGDVMAVLEIPAAPSAVGRRSSGD